MKDIIAKFRVDLEAFRECVTSAKAVPLSNKLCVIDREQLKDILNKLYDDAPEVFKESEKIIAERANIINEAQSYSKQKKDEADHNLGKQAIIAENERKKLIGDARKLIDDAQIQAREIIQKANNDANNTLIFAQENARKTVEDASLVANQLVSEQEIYTRAKKEMEELTANTQAQVDGVYRDVLKHIDETLALLDLTISEKLTDIRVIRQQIDESFSQH